MIGFTVNVEIWETHAGEVRHATALAELDVDGADERMDTPRVQLRIQGDDDRVIELEVDDLDDLASRLMSQLVMWHRRQEAERLEREAVPG